MWEPKLCEWLWLGLGERTSTERFQRFDSMGAKNIGTSHDLKSRGARKCKERCTYFRGLQAQGHGKVPMKPVFESLRVSRPALRRDFHTAVLLALLVPSIVLGSKTPKHTGTPQIRESCVERSHCLGGTVAQSIGTAFREHEPCTQGSNVWGINRASASQGRKGLEKGRYMGGEPSYIYIYIYIYIHTYIRTYIHIHVSEQAVDMYILCHPSYHEARFTHTLNRKPWL